MKNEVDAVVDDPSGYGESLDILSAALKQLKEILDNWEIK